MPHPWFRHEWEILIHGAPGLSQKMIKCSSVLCIRIRGRIVCWFLDESWCVGVVGVGSNGNVRWGFDCGLDGKSDSFEEKLVCIGVGSGSLFIIVMDVVSREVRSGLPCSKDVGDNSIRCISCSKLVQTMQRSEMQSGSSCCSICLKKCLMSPAN